MAKRTAWLYLGLPHTGGPAVAEAAAEHADTLRAHGVGLPAASVEQMRRASAELRRDHAEQGYRRRDVEGAWAAVCRRAWRDGLTPLLGDELLAAADADQVALLLDGLAGLRPRVVVALRDPAALLVDGWAAEVRQGRTPTFARYAERVLDPDDEHAQAVRFRATHNVPALLDRWAGALGPERVHVVVLPPGGDPADALWRQMLGLLGIGADPTVLAGPTMRGGAGAAGTAVMREVNAALKGRLSREQRRELLLDWLPDAGVTDPEVPPGLPDDVFAEVTAMAEKWRARVAESGVDVRGDLEDLIPAARPPDRPGPDEAPAAEALELTTRALGAATLEVSSLREHVAELQGRTAQLERKRTKLKRRLAHLGG